MCTSVERGEGWVVRDRGDMISLKTGPSRVMNCSLEGVFINSAEVYLKKIFIQFQNNDYDTNMIYTKLTGMFCLWFRKTAYP